MAIYIDKNGNVTNKKKKKAGIYLDEKGNVINKIDTSVFTSPIKDLSTFNINGQKVTLPKSPTFSEAEQKLISKHLEETEKRRQTEKRTWLEKGYYEDGYDFGDYTKSLWATRANIAENVGTAILGLGEKAVDSLAALAPYLMQGNLNEMPYQTGDVADFNRQIVEESKKQNAKFIAKDLYNEEKVAKSIITKPFETVTGLDTEKGTVLGEKSQALVQSATQLCAQLGLQQVGIPWYVTMGVSTFGSEVENATIQGATLDEAVLSGAITTGGEIISEKLFGAFGGKIDDLLAKTISQNVANKFVAKLLKAGIDISGEGVEEVLSDYISRFGQWLTYDDEKTLWETLNSEEAIDERMEAFISGALLGGAFTGGKYISSKIKGYDYLTGELITPKFSFGTTQESINSYIEASYKKENTEDYKKYALPSQRLLKDVSSDVDISNFSHALRDNDIRHIKNSHGEETSEKYPITIDDIKRIPWIVENYDKVFVKTNAKNQPGIVYVKVMPDNVAYYVEAITQEYHGEKLLVNKQMVKTGIDNIPKLYGLETAINKKQSSSQYLAELQELRKAYVHDVKENHSNENISHVNKKVNSFTIDEQKVIDAEVDRIATEKKKNGEKVKRSEIYDEVERNLKKGYIGIDTIESVLSGKEYGEYKTARDTEAKKVEELQGEIKSLEEKINASENVSSEDRQKLSELRKELDGVLTGSKWGELKTKLDNSVYERVKNSALAESYNERARLTEKFKADLSQYTEKEQRIVQKAIDSGVLNNTNRSHELVDLVAKLSADKGVDFDFMNNEKLKESGFAIEGKTVNGFVTKDGIVINTQSPKYLNSVVGHEITHVLKGSELFDSLQSTLFDYAKSRGEYDTRLNALTETYKGIENVDINEELTADLVGDYLFTDRDFVASLSTNNRNVFEWLYNEIKYLCKIATAGTKEARELLKVKKIFDEVYRGETKAVEGVSYSVSQKLNSDLDAVLDGTFDASKNEVYIGETSNFMVDTIGAKALSLYMPASKAYSAMVTESEYNKKPHYSKQDHYHGIGKEDFMEILEKSETPLVAFAASSDEKGNSRRNRIVLVADKKIKNPETGSYEYAVVVEEVDSNARVDGKRIKANKTITIYPRAKLYEDIQTAVVDGRLLDITKKGELLFAGGRGSNPQAAIQKDALKRNIANFWANVKWKGEKTSSSSQKSTLTPVQMAFQKAGLLDQDGQLQYMQDDKNKLHNLSKSKFSLFSIAPEIAPDGNFKITSEDVTLKTPEVQRKAESDLGDIPIRDDIKKLSPEDIAPPVREKITNKLTGEEIDNNTYNVLERLSKGETVTAEELSSLKEVREGKKKLGLLVEDFISQHPEMKIYDPKLIGTDLIESEERTQLRNDIIRERLKEGSFSGVDSNGKEVYNGNVNRSRRIDIVIGLPAAGKSTVIVNPLSREYNSVVIDSDIIKQRLPEYNDGWGSMLVHEESSQINALLLDQTMSEGKNIVLPIVGSKVTSVEKYIEQAKDHGYSINLHLNELPNGKAIGRMLNRYFSQGRFIDPTFALAYGDKPTAVYEEMKRRSDINEYSKWSNDVERGEPAVLVERGNGLVGGPQLGDGIYQAGNGESRTEGRENFEGIEREEKSGTSTKTPVTDIAPPITQTSSDGDVFFDGASKTKERSWVKTATESDVVDNKILAEDLSEFARSYVPISNEATLEDARTNIASLGYDVAKAKAVSLFASGSKASLVDIAESEVLLSEAIRKGDTKTAGEIIENLAILGTELGQKVQALSLINRMTPEGQLKMLEKIVKRAQAKIDGKGAKAKPRIRDKAFEGVEITQEIKNTILGVYEKDGSFDRDELNRAVDEAKQMLADQMSVTFGEKVNAWRYLSMLGNPKTHLRNVVSNVAMMATTEVKNAVARTAEDLFLKSGDRTKTWKAFTEAVTAFAQETAYSKEMEEAFNGEGKYSDVADMKSKRRIFENKILQKTYGFNSNALSKEDILFKRQRFNSAFREFLTANGIETAEDIKSNHELVEKGKRYALEQAEIATFQQHSVLASEITKWANRHDVLNVGLSAVLPFKKTPINIAKAGLNYSPLGFAKSLAYDIPQLMQGNIDASTLIDNLSQNLTGTGLMLLGLWGAMEGILNGAGGDDDESEFDYQLGEQSYSITLGNNTYSLDWLSPVAMPLFIGANAYETFCKKEGWSLDLVIEALAKTTDPLSEMSILSSLDNVLSSYSSGTGKWGEMVGEMSKSYIGQYIPTVLSQTAATFDSVKRTTKPSANSKFTWGEEVLNSVMYKIPGLRNLLEPSLDIWGNEIKQNENPVLRAVENFASVTSRRELNASAVNEELKDVYNDVGESGIFPSVPKSTVTYKGEKYLMSDKEYTQFKREYGEVAHDMLNELFNTSTYQNATDDEKAEYIEDVYTLAKDEAKRKYLEKNGVTYTNSTKDKVPYYKENSIKGAIEKDMTPAEYEYFQKDPDKYTAISNFFDYGEYDEYKTAIGKIEGIKINGETVSGSRKANVVKYIRSLDVTPLQKIILFRMAYPSDHTYTKALIEYVANLTDLSVSERRSIIKGLGYEIDKDGTVRW